MVQYYNLSNLSVYVKGEDFLGFAKGIDALVFGGQWIGLFVLVSFFVVMFLSLKFRGHYTVDALATASFVNALLAILMRAGGLIDNYTWGASISLVAIAVFALFMTGNTQ